VVNWYFKTRKWLFLEERLKLKKAYIVDIPEKANNYYESLKMKIVSDEELKRKDNMFRNLGYLPDIYFHILVTTYDVISFAYFQGAIIQVVNDADTQELKVGHRDSLMTHMIKSHYWGLKDRLLVVYNGGLFRVYEAVPTLKMSK